MSEPFIPERKPEGEQMQSLMAIMAISPGERFATSVCRSDCRCVFEALSFSSVASLSQESEVEVIIVGTPTTQQ
ncbi:hypothetical protein Q7C36_016231 [Tachysurus vachellii]|uniref:Uncharacterized protein n=1 Tax=Tachysurus vachellii TaxID=175792 RepID=A0AA88S944_TACVA|nr:hypothetical protein Q7C36_016231 [Tachysurus vachellii]